jgi:hypothetical protein
MFFASDRQLTAVHGAHKGQRVHDDTCKLVSVCNIFGIGYTGWAEVGGKPTHEWIALQLAEVGCVDPGDTAARLASAAAAALASPLKPLEQSFLLAGWVPLKAGGLRAHMRLVTNTFDPTGKAIQPPGSVFYVYGLPGANLNDCAQQRRSAPRNGPAPPAFRGAGAKDTMPNCCGSRLA